MKDTIGLYGFGLPYVKEKSDSWKFVAPIRSHATASAVPRVLEQALPLLREILHYLQAFCAFFQDPKISHTSHSLILLTLSTHET